MTSEEHLQISDILAYRERRLSAEDHTMAVRHLIQCVECRNRLPRPAENGFWNSLIGTGEETMEPSSHVPVWIAIKEAITGPMLGRAAVRNGVFASLLGLAILGFSLLLLIPGETFENENLVAAVDDSDPRNPIHPASFDREARGEVINSETSPPSEEPKPGLAEQDIAKSDPSRSRKKSGRTKEHRTSAPRSRKQAETRGKTPCGGQRSVALEARHTDEGLLLSWEKVRGASLYSVYLSDLDERLIDQFETGDKTSYLVTAGLDAEIVYRLRLIVTLDDGEKIVSESMNFTVNDLKNGSRSFGSISIRKKTAASVRCVEVRQ